VGWHVAAHQPLSCLYAVGIQVLALPVEMYHLRV